MVQELLNRTDEHLWALLANGLRLRLLRDSTALAGSAFVEFDLEAIFDGELFAEFLLLWQTQVGDYFYDLVNWLAGLISVPPWLYAYGFELMRFWS